MAKITNDSHLDHGLTERQKDFVRGLIAMIDTFKVLTIELPEELGTLTCGLHGPATGGAPIAETEVAYATRGKRAGSSRIVARAPVETRLLSVIVGPHNGDVILYTAFGGPVAPREPFDPDIKSDEERARSRAFWSEHALSV